MINPFFMSCTNEYYKFNKTHYKKYFLDAYIIIDE